MSSTRNIINDFRFEISAGNRKCDVNSSHTISKGEKHFAYEKIHGQRTNICMNCAPAILAKAKEHLDTLLVELEKS